MSEPDADDAGRGGGRRREVVVPLRLYKTVTVFSTLTSVVAVVLGFTLLDAATLQVSLLRTLLTDTLGAVGIVVETATLSAALAVCGLLTIALGAGTYVLGTRFRTAEMGKGEDDASEQSNDG